MGLDPLVAALLSITPVGDITGWKISQEGHLIELRIPADAKRSNVTGWKCRAEFAEVGSIFGATVVRSRYCSDFTYQVGETIRPTEPFDEDRWNECSSGIHFFLTREEAEAYR